MTALSTVSINYARIMITETGISCAFINIAFFPINNHHMLFLTKVVFQFSSKKAQFARFESMRPPIQELAEIVADDNCDITREITLDKPMQEWWRGLFRS